VEHDVTAYDGARRHGLGEGVRCVVVERGEQRQRT
jgi:hypothetical protein